MILATAHYDVTPVKVAAAILLYAALVVVFPVASRRIAGADRRTAVAIGGAWAVSVFVANYLLYKAGVMSFLPWVNNFLHTFVWIGICLTILYMGTRERERLPVLFVYFATFSIIVKYGEQLLFGTWDHDHFFFEFLAGNWVYVLGWSLADGLYPVLTLYGVRLAARFVPRLRVI